MFLQFIVACLAQFHAAFDPGDWRPVECVLGYRMTKKHVRLSRTYSSSTQAGIRIYDEEPLELLLTNGFRLSPTLFNQAED